MCWHQTQRGNYIFFRKQVSEKVAKGELDSAVAIIRPPGHHAEQDEAMGFCLFNNVAISASFLLNEKVRATLY